MIFYYKKEITEPGFECDKFCVLLYSVKKDDDNELFYTTQSLLSDLSLLDVERANGSQVLVALLPGENVPVLILSSCTNDKRVLNVSPLFGLVKRYYDRFNGDIPSEVLKQIRDKFIEILKDAKLATTILAACKQQCVWESLNELDMPLVIDNSFIDPDFKVQTRAFIDNLNESQTNELANLSKADNVTLFQSTCEDKLFIEIPSRVQLLDDNAQLSNFMPSMESVCVPYTDQNAYSPDYKQLGIPQYMLKYIEGMEANNKTAIYDNEKMYYDALTSWVEFNMKEEFGTDSGNVIDSVSQAYLSELISNIYMWHWRHNSSVPIDINYNNTADDSESIDSRYVFRQTPGSAKISGNAITSLLNYLDEASVKLGYKVYIDTVIQIARWGDRKPTCILFDDYEYIFDLGKGVSKSKLGDLANYKVELQEDGCESKIVSLIYDDVNIGDVNTVGYSEWPMAVGAVAETILKDDTGHEMTTYTYYSMIDLIRLVILDGLNISGIKFENEKFVTGDITSRDSMISLINSIGEDTDNTKFSFYRSESLLNLALDLKLPAKAVPENILCIMHERLVSPMLAKEMDNASFSTHDELINKVTKGKILQADIATYLNVVRIVLPVYQGVAKTIASDANFADTVNCWFEVMKSTGYGDEESFYRDRTTECKHLPGVSVSQPITDSVRSVTSATQPVTSFDENHKDVTQEVSETGHKEEGVNKSEEKQKTVTSSETKHNTSISLLRNVNPDMQFLHIMYNGEEVAICAMEILKLNTIAGVKAYKRYVVLDATQQREISDDKFVGNIDLLTILAHVTNNLLRIEMGNTEQMQLFFETNNAIMQFRNKINAIGKSST